MILYTPLAIPKLEINNWNEWWETWNTHSQYINKASTNHNQSTTKALKGFDLYVEGNVRTYSLYDAVLAPKRNVIDNLVEQIFSYVPLIPKLIRVMENTTMIPSHSDYSRPRDEFRSVLWNTYDEPLWEFTYNNEKRKLYLPPDSNSFYYKDYPLQHSAIYDPMKTKGLLLVYGPIKSNHTDIVEKSAATYKEYAWTI